MATWKFVASDGCDCEDNELNMKEVEEKSQQCMNTEPIPETNAEKKYITESLVNGIYFQPQMTNELNDRHRSRTILSCSGPGFCLPPLAPARACLFHQVPSSTLPTTRSSLT